MIINNILVTGRLFKELEPALTPRTDKQFRFLAEADVSLADIQWADAFVAFRPTTNFEFAGLKWVHALGAGVDSFLFKRRWKEDVVLTRTVCSFGQKISEYCLSYMLRHLQLQPYFEEAQHRRLWSPEEPQGLASQRVVVFGTGSIGQEIARNLMNFGVHVTGVSLSGAFKEPFHRVVKPHQLNNILNEADWVINTLPLTSDTENLFNEQLFRFLENACLINVGRGASINETDLLQALDKKNLRLAVLDVFTEEPLSPDSKLWGRPDIIITPHISAITSVPEAEECFLVTLQRLEAGADLPNAVNITRGY